MEKTIVNKPDFFIVGAPKCGTTALAHYLSQHPNIFMPELKEIYFFGNDLTYKRNKLSLKEYYQLFSEAKKNQLIGEATAVYLRSSEASKEILAFNPNAKIIIMLRNPVDMIHALHSEVCFNGNELELDFEKAIQLEELRKNGLKIPNQITCPVEILLYREMALFYEQVKRYIEVFPTQNIHIILYEDLKNNPEKTYSFVLKFLELPHNFTPSFKIINPNKQNKSRKFAHFLNYFPSPLKKLSRVIIPHKTLREKIYLGLKKKNTKYTNRKPITPSFKQDLKDYFRQDIIKLEKLIKKDLSSWK